MISKQLLLGVSLVFGGGILLYAMGNTKDSPTPAKVTTVTDEVARPTVQPLTADLETEQRILAQKKQEREARSQAQEKSAMALIAEHERAKSIAEGKAQNEQKNNQKQTTETATDLTVQTRPEAVAALKAEERRLAELKEAELKRAAELRAEQESAKQKETAKPKEDNVQVKSEQNFETKPAQKTEPKPTNGTHKVSKGDGLIKLSHQYGIPVSVLAAANNMGRNDALPLGKTIKIPSKSEVAKIEREAKEKEAKRVASEKADKRLKDARNEAKNDTKSNSGNGNDKYSVQVSLATNQAKADELVKQYKAAGYSVTTSQTSRGVRVLVGSERSADAAAALKDKIKNDSRVKGGGAWVKRVE